MALDVVNKPRCCNATRCLTHLEVTHSSANRHQLCESYEETGEFQDGSRI